MNISKMSNDEIEFGRSPWFTHYSPLPHTTQQKGHKSVWAFQNQTCSNDVDKTSFLLIPNVQTTFAFIPQTC